MSSNNSALCDTVTALNSCFHGLELAQPENPYAAWRWMSEYHLGQEVAGLKEVVVARASAFPPQQAFNAMMRSIHRDARGLAEKPQAMRRCGLTRCEVRMV